jgi:CheY-like chemotaxis protein
MPSSERNGERYGVLIVDDNDDTRELFAEFLALEGYHSIMARDGREALSRLQYVRPDAIISDLDMPEIDGAELIRHLQSKPVLRTIPVLILTGAEGEQVARKLGTLAPHVRTVIRKPVNLSELVRALADAIAAAGATGATS